MPSKGCCGNMLCRLPEERSTVPSECQELHAEFYDLIPWADGIFDKHFT